MWVQCILCDRYVEISDETAVAKRFKKRPDYAFLCSRCGGGLAELELNVTDPGVLPQELAGDGRLDRPAFAAWSEPAKPRIRSRRVGEGTAPGPAPGLSPTTAVTAAAVELPPRPPREEGRRGHGDRRPGAQTGQAQPVPPGAQASANGGPPPERGDQPGEGRHRRRRGRHGKGPGAGQTGENGQTGQGAQNGQKGGSAQGGVPGGQQPQGNHEGRHGDGGRRGRHGQPRNGGQPSGVPQPERQPVR